MHIPHARSHKKGQLCCPLRPWRLFRRELDCAVRYGDWRRRLAALLGRFLPKLRAAFERPFFWDNERKHFQWATYKPWRGTVS